MNRRTFLVRLGTGLLAAPSLSWAAEDVRTSGSAKLKAVIVGEDGVGKTSLLLRMSTGAFPADKVPSVSESYEHKESIGGSGHAVTFWDTAGDSGYDRLRPFTYPHTDVFVIAYALDQPDTLQKVTSRWLPEIEKHRANAARILVGCKLDLKKDGPKNPEAQRVRDAVKAFAYLECSAKDGRQVVDVAAEAARAALWKSG